MKAEHLEDIREQSRLANLTPGEAIAEHAYEEHLEAVKAAPALLKALLDHAHESDCARAFAEGRCADWHRISQTLRLENDVLWTRVHAAEGRASQNQRIREMWLEERARKDRPDLHDRVDELAREVRELKREARSVEECRKDDRREVNRLRALVPFEFRFSTPETNDAIFAKETA